MDERTKKLLHRGRAHYKAGEYDKARRVLEPLAQHNLPFADVYAMLGVIQYQQGNRTDAALMFEEALRLNPAYTEASLHLAVTYNDMGKFEDAKRVHQRMLQNRKPIGAARVDPFVQGKIANMHAEVAAAYEQSGLYSDAAQEYRRALGLCPTYTDLRVRLGVCLRTAGDTASSATELESAKTSNPKLPAPRLQLGMTHYVAGRHDAAEREWRDVLKMDPSHKLGKLYLRLVDGSNAKKKRQP
jgi:tetratricopeptide (TPR) repeat protein